MDSELNFNSQTLTISGTLTRDSEVYANYTYQGQEVGKMRGPMNEKEGNGIWENPTYQLSGTWVGTKK
ncbi:hypothetical protein AB4865_05545 [Capnocytophaga sp. ARDL2]|uniref:hypothetical protein n=1 Tax=Capnocytophaga sp. ARDL2 TaxID=3238809 RepID=UPI0035575560